MAKKREWKAWMVVDDKSAYSSGPYLSRRDAEYHRKLGWSGYRIIRVRIVEDK